MNVYCVHQQHDPNQTKIIIFFKISDYTIWDKIGRNSCGRLDLDGRNSCTYRLIEDFISGRNSCVVETKQIMNYGYSLEKKLWKW